MLGPIPSHWEICFVAGERSSTPIGELDRDNNTACKPFTYGVCRGLVSTESIDDGTSTAHTFQGFTLTPNPSPGQIQINYAPVEAPVHIGIFILQGQQLQQAQLQADEQTGNAHFDLSSYPAGIYMVQMQEGNRAPVSRKLIIE
ncbi:MAG: T9SS type A sorting domain-containing protein [Bacteroidota bacterium]